MFSVVRGRRATVSTTLKQLNTFIDVNFKILGFIRLNGLVWFGEEKKGSSGDWIYALNSIHFLYFMGCFHSLEIL